MPYRADFSAGGCTGESVGDFTVRVRANRAPAPAGTVGTVLNFEVRKSGTVTHAVRCPQGGAPPQKQTWPETTAQISLPLADEATLSVPFYFSGTLNNVATLRLPCQRGGGRQRVRQARALHEQELRMD